MRKLHSVTFLQDTYRTFSINLSISKSIRILGLFTQLYRAITSRMLAAISESKHFNSEKKSEENVTLKDCNCLSVLEDEHFLVFTSLSTAQVRDIMFTQPM